MIIAGKRKPVSGVTESCGWYRRDAGAVGPLTLEHFTGPDQQSAQCETKTAVFGMRFPPNGQLLFPAESTLILLKRSFELIQFNQHVMLLFVCQNHPVNTFRIGPIQDIRGPNSKPI
jgi:hypothetical protein